MTSGEFAVDPDGGRIEYRLELDPDGTRLPLLRGRKPASVPRQASILLCPTHDLPGVGQNDRRPIARGQFGLMPVLGCTAAIGIETESPLTRWQRCSQRSEEHTSE